MQNQAVVIDPVEQGRAHRLVFATAVVALVAAFAAVGSTIPVFNIYRAEEGSTNAGSSMTRRRLLGTIGTLRA